MIVLDTNVLSEPLKTNPSARVLSWLAALDEPATITAVTVGELLTGVGRLPLGRRRSGLHAAIDRALLAFTDDVLPYDAAAAREYARMQEVRRAAGNPLSTEDGMIAAISAVRGATLATRNTADFGGLGVGLIDPWAPTTDE